MSPNLQLENFFQRLKVNNQSFEIIEYDPTHKDLISKPIFLKK